MANVVEGKPDLSHCAWARCVEHGIYRLCGIDPKAEMGWKQYAISLLLLNTLGVIVVYALQRLQVAAAVNPQHFAAVSARGFLVQHRRQLRHQHELAGATPAKSR